MNELMHSAGLMIDKLKLVLSRPIFHSNGYGGIHVVKEGELTKEFRDLESALGLSKIDLTPEEVSQVPPSLFSTEGPVAVKECSDINESQ